MADHASQLTASILRPGHPERTCWGCDLYCPANDLRCGNGTIRTPHPIELFGADWQPEEDRERLARDAPGRR
jgi:hypothetical protein